MPRLTWCYVGDAVGAVWSWMCASLVWSRSPRTGSTPTDRQQASVLQSGPSRRYLESTGLPDVPGPMPGDYLQPEESS